MFDKLSLSILCSLVLVANVNAQNTTMPTTTDDTTTSTDPSAPYPTNTGGGQVWDWSTVYPDVFCEAAGCNVGPVPDTNSSQVLQWLSEIDLSKVPDIPVVASDGQGDPTPAADTPADYCDWTVNQCVRPTDVTYCPKIGDWGLTYDDGPTQYSPQIYDFLDTTQQKATLFYIGSNVWLYPYYAKRACESGHQIGLHTWSHHGLTTLTNEQLVAEMKWTEKIIKEVCGITPIHMRPPFGDVDDRVRAVMAAMGYKVIIWDQDTNDYNMGPGGSVTSEQVAQEFAGWIADRQNDTHGHITLEHELYQTTVDAAIANLPLIQKAFSVKPVYECIGDTHPYLENVSPLNINQTLTTNNAPTATATNSNTASLSSSTTTSITTKASGGSNLSISAVSIFATIFIGIVLKF